MEHVVLNMANSPRAPEPRCLPRVLWDEMLNMTFCYLSFHGYSTWLDVKSCTCPLDCDSKTSRMTSFQEPVLLSTKKQKQKTTKLRQQFCFQVCKPVITFHPVYPTNHPANVNSSFFSVDLQFWLLLISPFCLYSLFKSFIRFSHWLAPFSIPSAQHAWSGQRREPRDP